MTRKEKEEKILELFGLKVGDRILVKSNFSLYNNKILEIEDFEDHFVFREINRKTVDFNILILIDSDWQKIEPSLKDSKCRDFDHCEGCPIHEHAVYCSFVEDYENQTIEYIVNTAKKDLEALDKELFGDEK